MGVGCGQENKRWCLPVKQKLALKGFCKPCPKFVLKAMWVRVRVD